MTLCVNFRLFFCTCNMRIQSESHWYFYYSFCCEKFAAVCQKIATFCHVTFWPTMSLSAVVQIVDDLSYTDYRMFNVVAVISVLVVTNVQSISIDVTIRWLISGFLFHHIAWNVHGKAKLRLHKRRIFRYLMLQIRYVLVAWGQTEWYDVQLTGIFTVWICYI